MKETRKMDIGTEAESYIIPMGFAMRANLKRAWEMDMEFWSSIIYRYTMEIGSTIKSKAKARSEIVP